MEPQGCARHRWANRQVEWSVWESDIEGEAAREAVSELGKERASNERERISQAFGVLKRLVEPYRFRSKFSR